MLLAIVWWLRTPSILRHGRALLCHPQATHPTHIFMQLALILVTTSTILQYNLQVSIISRITTIDFHLAWWSILAASHTSILLDSGGLSIRSASYFGMHLPFWPQLHGASKLMYKPLPHHLPSHTHAERNSALHIMEIGSVTRHTPPFSSQLSEPGTNLGWMSCLNPSSPASMIKNQELVSRLPDQRNLVPGSMLHQSPLLDFACPMTSLGLP